MEIGVYCTSIRPNRWGKLYQTLSRNNVHFNLCIAGPCPPLTELGPLPPNMKYVYTNVKPPQCCLVAANNTEGDYIMLATDDHWYSDGCLDDLLNIVTSGKKIMATPTYQRESQYRLVTDFGWQREDKIDQYVMLDFPAPVCHMMRREDFNDIGIDRNFKGVYWDQDMGFEMVARGGQCIRSENSFTIDEQNAELSHLAMLSLSIGDYAYMVKMWTDNNTFRSQRRNPTDPLIYNDTVLTISQGPKLDCWD